jgi:hypothetical protein
VVVLAVLALAACGPSHTTGSSSSSTPTPSPATVPTIGTTPTPSGVGGGRCQTSQLSLSTGQHNAGAGSVQEAFIFTNSSPTACQLAGYPGMQMLAAGGGKIPTNVVRTPGSEPTVTLAPGGAASFLAQWHDQTGYTTPCATSQQVEVTPPDAFTQLTIATSIQACPDGTINVSAVTAGTTGGQ